MKIRRSVLLFSTVVVLVCGGACSSSIGSQAEGPGSAEAPSAPEAVRVSVAKPALRDIADRITLAGTVTPYEQVTLYARVDGYLNSIGIDIGDRVRKGQVLAEIDLPEMQASLEEKRAVVMRAEAALGQAQASVAQYEAEATFQKLNHERLHRIRQRDPDVLPQQEVDRALAELDVARSKLEKSKADIKVADAAIEAAKADLGVLERMAEYAKITAPITGVVTERFVDPGDLIQTGGSSRTQGAPIVSLARLDRVRILVDIPEPQAPYVHQGTGAAVRVAGVEPISAQCARTSNVLSPATRTMRAEIHLANAKQTLRPGMTADVTLDLRAIENALTVPVSAVRSQGDRYGVFVLDGDTAKQQVVKTGLESAEWIQITEGLSPEDQVIIATANPLTNGMRVTASAAGSVEQ